MFLRYEGTVWDDLAHGKGVYEAEQGLVRFDYTAHFLIGSFLIECIFPTLAVNVYVTEKLTDMKVNGYKTIPRVMGFLKLTYLLMSQSQVQSKFKIL